MHAAEREDLILQAIESAGFVSYRDLEARLDASPATIRRDLARLEDAGRIQRVHGGARATEEMRQRADMQALVGVPFEKSLNRNLAQKQAIGRAAAAMCRPNEGVLIDGGTTTFQMCPHLEGLELQVLTNSLHIVNALLPQQGTGVIVPSGSVFREQNIILAPGGEESMPRFHASKLFLGAAAVGRNGIMQQDAVLVASQRRLLEKAEKSILLVDSGKFSITSGAIVCPLEQIDIVITDSGLPDDVRTMLESVGIDIVIADR